MRLDANDLITQSKRSTTWWFLAFAQNSLTSSTFKFLNITNGFFFSKNPTRHVVSSHSSLPPSLCSCFRLPCSTAAEQEVSFFHVPAREKSQSDGMVLYWRAADGEGSLDWQVTLLTNRKGEKEKKHISTGPTSPVFVTIPLPLVWNPPLELQSDKRCWHIFDNRLNFAFHDEAL